MKPKNKRPTARSHPAKIKSRTYSPKSQSLLGRAFTSMRDAVRFIIAMVGRLIWAIVWRIGLAVGLILGLAVFYFHSQLPPATEMLDARVRGSVTLLDYQNHAFAWRGKIFGGQIRADHVSDYLRHAIIAAEDQRFYQHFGISVRGILGAIRINLREGRGPLDGNGGSTITQQVAKLLCLGQAYDPAQWLSEAAYEHDCRSGGIWRKIKEIPFSIAMEVKYTKDEILTIYLNRVYLGAGSHGFEAAAQRYFGTSAHNVSPAQAAMLAGLLTAPSRYAPTNNLGRARERAEIVIGLMSEQGYLSPTQTAEAIANPAQLSQAAKAKSGGAFADWVMGTAPSFLSSQTTEDVIIKTTLDPQIQKGVETAVLEVYENRIKKGSSAQVAIVVMSADGAVRAMVGGRKFTTSGQFNRATQARRQTGSSFKPFIYAAALDLGYHPFDLLDDSPLTLDIPGSGLWIPSNYDNAFKGRISLTQALAESRNIPAIRLSEAIGRDIVRQVATNFGIKSDLAQGPALALGASEASLLETTGAYAGILNGGQAVIPYGMSALWLRDDQTPLIGASGGIDERVISEKAARSLIYMMSRTIEEGTGTRARLDGIEAAGKTGTTQAARDAWFIGFTADYVAGVWMGYDDNTPLSGVTGGGLPAEIWHDVMENIYATTTTLQPRPLPMDTPDVSHYSSSHGPASPKENGASSFTDLLLQNILKALSANRPHN